MNAPQIEYDWMEVAAIWSDYDKGKISVMKRDALLAPGRAKLARDMNGTTKLGGHNDTA